MREKRKSNQRLNDILEELKRETINLTVVTTDEEVLVERTLNELSHRLGTREFTIDVAAITGLRSSARL